VKENEIRPRPGRFNRTLGSMSREQLVAEVVQLRDRIDRMTLAAVEEARRRAEYEGRFRVPTLADLGAPRLAAVEAVLRDVLMVCAGYLRTQDPLLLSDARAALDPAAGGEDLPHETIRPPFAAKIETAGAYERCSACDESETQCAEHAPPPASPGGEERP
jgi:hypothetical protein